MKRTLLALLIPALAVTSILLAQTGSATLRLRSGDRPITIVEQPEAAYFPVSTVIEALGGNVSRDGNGFLVTAGSTTAAISPESRFIVVGDDLTEMNHAPLVIEGRAWATIDFFTAVLGRSLSLSPQWDSTTRVLELRSAQVRPVAVRPSVVDLDDFTKVVLQFDTEVQYQEERRRGGIRLLLSNPPAPPQGVPPVTSRYVQRVAFGPREITIELKDPSLAADVYRLENPYRIVIDVRAAAAPAPAQPGLADAAPAPSPASGVRTIVIDPGHGGKEVGAIGPSGLMEKDLTLQIARRVATRLQSQLGIRVILTRDGDELVPLEQRTAIANRYQADLFLSIHLNAARVPGARGSETYFLSLDATDDAARVAAERENSSGGAAGSSGDLDFILWDLAHTASVRDSSRLAEMVQGEMNLISGITNRGVKQAPFTVLVGATMPAALVELAFISNPEEEAKLGTDAFQQQLAEAVVAAVSRYKSETEQRRSGLAGGGAPAAAAPGAER